MGEREKQLSVREQVGITINLRRGLSQDEESPSATRDALHSIYRFDVATVGVFYQTTYLCMHLTYMDWATADGFHGTAAVIRCSLLHAELHMLPTTSAVPLQREESTSCNHDRKCEPDALGRMARARHLQVLAYFPRAESYQVHQALYVQYSTVRYLAIPKTGRASRHIQLYTVAPYLACLSCCTLCNVPDRDGKSTGFPRKPNTQQHTKAQR